MHFMGDLSCITPCSVRVLNELVRTDVVLVRILVYLRGNDDEGVLISDCNEATECQHATMSDNSRFSDWRCRYMVPHCLNYSSRVRPGCRR